MNRRTMLTGVAGIGMLGLAGCLETLGLDEHEATPAGVATDALEETGYELADIDSLVIEEEVGIDAFSQEIVVANHVTEYHKTVEMPVPVLDEREGAIFTILSTPQIGIAGQNFNPVEGYSTRELVDLVEENYDDVGNIEHESDLEVTILDESTTVSKFNADATFEGTDVPVNLHVSEAVSTDDDLLVTIGVYPDGLGASEEENVQTLMENVVDEVEE